MIRSAFLTLTLPLLLFTASGCGDDAADTQKDATAASDTHAAAQDAGGPAPDATAPADAEVHAVDAAPSATDGPTTGGAFGDPCDKARPCAEGLACLIPSTAGEVGVCSTPCDTPMGDCTGGPEGTYPICVMPYQDGYYCAFLCEESHGHTHTYPCPEGLICDPQDNPAGSGQHLCVAPE